MQKAQINVVDKIYLTPTVKKIYMIQLHHVNPLNAELNPICHLLALLGGATIVVVSRLSVNDTCVCMCMCVCVYIYIYNIKYLSNLISILSVCTPDWRHVTGGY